MHRDDQRLELVEERSEYEAPAACDSGPAEEHTHGKADYDPDNAAGLHGAQLRGIAGP